MNLFSSLGAGGPIVVVILLSSLYAAFVFLDRLQKLRRAAALDASLLQQVRADLLAGSPMTAVADARRAGTPTARVLEAGLGRAALGQGAVEAAMGGAAALEEVEAGRGLGTLSTVAQVAPMLGLLGTVTGMIRTFGVFSAIERPTPTQLAGGIAEALVATAAGLAVAILAHVAHGVLARRVEASLARLDAAREEVAGWLMEAERGPATARVEERPLVEARPRG